MTYVKVAVRYHERVHDFLRANPAMLDSFRRYVETVMFAGSATAAGLFIEAMKKEYGTPFWTTGLPISAQNPMP